MKLKREFTEEYNNLKSAQSVQLISTIEPVLLKTLQANPSFGSSVTRVQVTQLRQGSVEVDFAVVMADPSDPSQVFPANPSQIVSDFINEEISNPNNTDFQDIGVDEAATTNARGLFCFSIPSPKKE